MISLSARVFTSFVIIVALIALADHFAGKPASDRDDPGFYRNDEHGFSIRFPLDWQISEGFMGTTVIGLRPMQGLNFFQESVAVTVGELDAPLPFQEFFTRELAIMKADRKNFEPDLPTETALGTQHAVRLVYEHEVMVFDLKAVAYFFTAGKKGYVITCTARPDSFEDFLEQFESVAGTFELAGGGP